MGTGPRSRGISVPALAKAGKTLSGYRCFDLWPPIKLGCNFKVARESEV
jgi:hypothetical protein